MALGKRGKKLLKSLAPEGSPAATVALAEEAARIADRLDELDRIIAGNGVLNLMRFRVTSIDFDDPEATVEVKFDNVLSEARQQAGALRQILSTLGIDAAKPAPAPKQSPAASVATDGSSSGGGGIESLAARRAERESRRRAASED